MALKASTSRHCYALQCSNGDYQLIKWRDAHGDVHQTRLDHPSCTCPPPFELFPFPSKKSDRERREKWLRNLNRGDELHSYKFKEPSKSHRVCSLHFIDSKPSHIHPDPEINLGHEVNKCQRHRDREQRLLKRRKVQDERQERISHCSQECDYERPSQTEHGMITAVFFSVGTKFLIFILLSDIRKFKNDLKAGLRENLQLRSEMSPTTKIITAKQYTVYIKSKTD
ncbi:hypothetical protein LSH36_137g03021 [Paralvinella palmiformis]|uniref:THAP-type domain-containing protein n=1 Tax=Paralvinella palmiformis TaxID=53620 RepID=A0AAD9JWQ8_9ANNE|nr:hypothetical protein LSH36_137g03021 [Paralvinella palmiformis]